MSTLCTFDADSLTCPACGYVAKKLPTFRTCKPPPKPYVPKPPGPPGPGHYLSKTLRYIGIQHTEDCECGPMAAKMDRLGVDWCESPEGMKEILEVMRREHAKRKLLLPWSDAAAAGLVRAACALARRAAA